MGSRPESSRRPHAVMLVQAGGDGKKRGKSDDGSRNFTQVVPQAQGQHEDTRRQAAGSERSLRLEVSWGPESDKPGSGTLGLFTCGLG